MTIDGIRTDQLNLKPCPFCGGRGHVWWHPIADAMLYHIECDDCKCVTSAFESLKAAIDAWNKRTKGGAR